MKGYYIALLLLLPSLCSNGQTLTKNEIISLVSSITADTSLRTIELDANDVFQANYDGGGIVQLIHDGQTLKAFVVQVGLSSGRLTNSIYYVDSLPVQIVETEERFKWIEAEGTFDFTTLNQTFNETVYVLDWELADTEHEKSGTRTLSEARCGLFEYEPEVVLGHRLLRENLKK